MIAKRCILWVGVGLLLLGCSEQPTGPGGSTLSFVTQPGYTIAKGYISPSVRVALQDERGHTITSFSGTVTVTLDASPSGAILSGTTTAAAVNGVASFSDLSIDMVGAGYALRALTPGLTGATSTAFKVTPLLAFTGQPGNAVAGTTITPAIQVSATDATGAVVSTFTDSVTVAIGASAGPATLSGTNRVAAVRGVATFSNLSINLGAAGYTLTAAASGIPFAANSGAFDVSCISNCWTVKAPMPISFASVAVGVINGVLYTAGGGAQGPTAAQAYDPVMNTWTPRASPPSSAITAHAAVINGVLYVVGGGSALTIQAYDPATDNWTAKSSLGAPSFPYGIAGFGVGALNGVLYAIGGGDVEDITTAACTYDPTTDGWTSGAMAQMLTHTDFPGVAVLNGIVYAVGGADYSGSALDVVQAYDPASDSWTTRAPMPTPRYDLAVGILNGVLYAIGGRNSSGPLGTGPLGTVEAYDPATDSWTSKPSLGTPRFGLAVGVVNGALYAVGGSGGGQSLLTVVEAYTP